MTRSKNSRKSLNFHPALENLEDRCVPAVISSSMSDLAIPAVQSDWAKAMPEDPVLKQGNSYAYIPAVQSDWAKAMPEDPVLLPPPYGWACADPQPEPPTKLAVNGTLSPGQAKVTGQLDVSAHDAILIGMLRPVEVVPRALPAVQDWVKADPQPVPPTPPGQIDADYANILIGMLNQGDQAQASDPSWAVPEDPNFALPNDPNFAVNPNALPAVQDWLKIDPQPASPKPLPGQLDADFVAILIGMLTPAQNGK